MLYFKHNDLVDRFRVSLKTVHNWIDAAKEGKVNLQLHEYKGKTYIANTSSNFVALEYLAGRARKFRNNTHKRVVSPSKEFYELFSQRQVLDIIFNLNIHREIPRQYNYFDEGAINWDKWLHRLEEEEATNILKGTLELMHTNLNVLDKLLEDYDRVNVVDVGVGNGRPVKGLLKHLLNSQKLNRYIAVDISESMLDIAKKNIKGWFGGQVKFEGYLKDVSFERFDDLLVEDMLSENAERTVNLVLVLGATPVNFPRYSDILKIVYESMSERDILLSTDIPDTEITRRYLDFSHQPGSAGRISPNHRFMLDLMNIDESLYEPDMGYDDKRRMRYVRIKLNTALSINFEHNSIKRTVELEKDDTILLLRVLHFKTLEILSEFENLGFTLLQTCLTKDRLYMLTISGVDTKTS